MSESHTCGCRNGNTPYAILNKIISENPEISVEELRVKAQECNSRASSYQSKN